MENKYAQVCQSLISHQNSLYSQDGLIQHLFMIASCIVTNEFKAKAIMQQVYVYKGK